MPAALTVSAACLYSTDSVSQEMLEEIIVTAQKRSESLQDVPASIAAFSGDMIDQLGWSDLDQLQESVPSLNIGGSGKSRPVVFIRGVGTRKFDIGADGSVGIFVDEVYNARFSSTLSGMMDIERIEVLKGPQGTLYGRNTIGGAISIITRKPSNKPRVKIKLLAGNESQYQYGLNASGPVVKDNLYGLISVMDSDIDGVFTDTVSGKTNNHRNSAYRAALLTDAIDNWELGLTFDHSKTSSDASLAEPLYGKNFPIVLVSPADPRIPEIVAEGSKSHTANAYSDPGFVDRDSSQLALKVQYFGDAYELTSITSFNQEELQELVDFDATPLNVAPQEVDQESSQASQEIRFNSVHNGFGTLENQLKWVVGLYYFQDEAERLDGSPYGNDSFLYPRGFNGVLSTEYLVEIETDSYALFGQSTYTLSEHANLTFGLRYTLDQKDYSYLATSNNNLPPVIEGFLVDDNLEFESLDPKISFDYHLSDLVMAYASFSRGFKSGGVQFANGDPKLAAQSFDEEQLDSYEIGMRGRYLEQTLQINSSLYYYDYTDQQMQGFVNVNGFPNALTENAGRSRMTGLEIETLALLSESLTLDVKYTWQDAKFDEFDAFSGDYSGNHMPFAPKHSATANLMYQKTIEQGGKIGLQVGLAYKDDFYFDYLNTEKSLQKAYSLLNLSAWWESDDGSLRLRAFCQNCTDKSYRTNAVSFSEPFDGGRNVWDYGRRYGIELTHNFL